MSETDRHPDRRTVLRTGAVGCAAIFQAFLAGPAQGRLPQQTGRRTFGPYGLPQPKRDQTTGLPLLHLPPRSRDATTPSPYYRLQIWI